MVVLKDDTVKKEGTLVVDGGALIELPKEGLFVSRITSYVEQHLGETSVSISDMAKYMAVSRAQLYRFSQLYLGLSPKAFVRQQRFRKALRLLEEKDDKSLSVTEIAYKCGFNDAKYFSRRFKVAIGMSPTEYRTGKQKERRR